MPECAICGIQDSVSLVPHFRESHDLATYLAVFPDLPVVSLNLFTAIENLTYFDYRDSDLPELDQITKEEREMLLVSAKNNAPIRSEILVENDF